MSKPISDEDLNAYLDGELDAEATAVVEAGLASDSAMRARLEADRRIRDALAGRYQERIDAAVPERLLQVVRTPSRPGWRAANWRMLAAGLVLAMASAAGGYIAGDRAARMEGASQSIAQPALGAHAVFVSEVRHPVEVPASEEAHLVKWLTKRIGGQIRAPDLVAAGYRLVGGRLLAEGSMPAAQLMYEEAGGRRLTLYVRRAMAENTSFRFAQAGSLETFYWVDRHLAYALVGPLPRDELQQIARTVYEQLTN